MPLHDGRVYRLLPGKDCRLHRLLVKPVEAAKKRMPQAPMEPPYEGAKDMLLVEDLDDKDFLTKLFESMYEELPAPKPKKKKIAAKP